MLTLIRRHTRNCKTKKHLPMVELRKCTCPLAINGVDRGGKYRNHEALGTRELDIAGKLLAKIDLGESLPTPASNRVSIADAFERFKTILTGQKQVQAQSIIHNVVPLQKSMLKFAEHKGLKWTDQVDQAFVDEWLGTWTLAPSTRAMRMSTLSQFLTAALKRRWVEQVPELMKPKTHQGGKTLPFDLEHEDAKILAGAWKWETAAPYKRANPSPWMKMPRMATGFVYLLRATGMRFSDAMRFDPRALVKRTVRGRDVYCYYEPHQVKTGAPVFIPLSAEMAEPIINAPRLTERYPFWDGVTPTNAWNARFGNCVTPLLETVSGVANIHPHRFRDTFACDLLDRNISIRTVSRLLGHKSIATTIKYYEHWVRGDQDRLVDTLMDAWDVDTSKKVVKISR
jgi:integrase/recombinase XerD